MAKTGKVYLIPNTLGDTDPNEVLPNSLFGLVEGIDHYIVENEKVARRFLIKLGQKGRLDEIQLQLFDNKRESSSPEQLFAPALSGSPIGIISDAGSPAVADPGAQLIDFAHRKGLQVVPLSGPSSIIMGLMASGMNGQQFTFHGYLPKDRGARVKKIKLLESMIRQSGYTQIFIETPYRNNHLLEDLIQHCSAGLRLCIASNISCPNEFIRTQAVADWKKRPKDLSKQPTIFLLNR